MMCMSLPMDSRCLGTKHSIRMKKVGHAKMEEEWKGPSEERNAL